MSARRNIATRASWVGTAALLVCAANACIGCAPATEEAKDEALSGAAFMTANVDGAAWSSAEGGALWSAPHDDAITVQGAPADNTSGILLNVSGYDGPGTYEFSGTTIAQFIGGALSAEPGSWNSTTGTVEVTADDGERVAGAFSFEGTDANLGTSKSITDGAFLVDQQ